MSKVLDKVNLYIDKVENDYYYYIRLVNPYSHNICVWSKEFK